MDYIDEKKISIIIPVFNVEKFLAECLESAINQTYDNKEIIVVNDGSTDKSYEIIKKYKEIHNELTVINTENKGLSSARNTGLERASGNYIIFLDSDDWLEEDTLKICISALKKQNADIVFFNAESFSNDINEGELKKFNYTRPNHLNYKRISCNDIFVELVDSNNYIVSACLYLYNRKKFESVKFYPGITHEDNLFTTQLLLANNNNIATCIPDRLFHRRVRLGSIMTEEKSIKHVEGYLTVAEELLSHKIKNKNNNVEKSLSIFIQSMIINATQTNQKISKQKKKKFTRIKALTLLAKINPRHIKIKSAIICILPEIVIIKKNIYRMLKQS